MVLPFVAQGEDKEDCSCPKVSCGPCQKKVSVGKIVRFCDWGDINVCRKTVCENVNYYFGCLSNLKKEKKKNEEEAALAKSDIVLPYEEKIKNKKVKSKSKPIRKISSVANTGLPERDDKVDFNPEGLIEVDNDSRVFSGVNYSDVVVGKVKSLKGSLSRMHRGSVMNLLEGDPLYVGDEVNNKTKKNQKLVFEFENGKVNLVLEPKSKLTIQDPHSIVGRFQPFVYLVYGGVKVKSFIKEGSFDLLAGQILIRSQNAESEVQYEMDKGSLKVKVESLKGDVEVVKAQDLSGESIVVKEGSFVSWMSETMEHLFTADEKAALAGEGFITPVFEMDKRRRKKLGLIKEESPLFADWTKKKSNSRSIASADDGICQSPQAEYQQCAWTCEGNSKGSKECQAHKANVHCVRRLCNAAGQWGAATPFASSYKDLCPAQGTRVGDCSP